ncbi:MAG: hypothetical protein ACW97V_05705 [Promethearchaeota archaeon]
MGNKIKTNSFKITIGSNPILIDERFTLIKGKFSQKSLEPYVSSIFPELLKDIDSIPIKKLINAQISRSDKLRSLRKSTNLLKILNNHKYLMTSNIDIISRYNEVMKSLILMFKYNVLLKKKEELGNELIVSEKYRKLNDITARMDLLKKLNESLDKNKKKLEYLAEDFFQQQNQIDQITDSIKSCELKIQNLTSHKKKIFSYINRITREMSGTPKNQELKWEEHIEIDPNLTNSQKIKVFQKRAKDAQVEISKTNSVIKEFKLKYQELNPRYETYRQDYQKLRELINLDKNKIEDLQRTVKVELKENETGKDGFISEFDLNLIRSKQEIQDELKSVNFELTEISLPLSPADPQNPQDISQPLQFLNDINETLKIELKKAGNYSDEEEIRRIFESFNEFETSTDIIESIINIFLRKINLQTFFRIALSSDDKNFFVDIKFLRNNKEDIRYDQLTTPEKIFFNIAFYLAIEVQTNQKYIIFSNLSLPPVYNKAGSIYRTIRNIIPLFESEERLSNYNLVFILSSLEMKKEIKNLKIITIQNNEKKPK